MSVTDNEVWIESETLQPLQSDRIEYLEWIISTKFTSNNLVIVNIVKGMFQYV